MKTKTAIYYAAMFLSLEEVCDMLEGGERTAETEKECNILLKCANLIVNEIAHDWIPLKTREKIEVENGEYHLKNLSKNAIDVYKITDKYGNDIKFRQFYDRLFCENGEYEIEYSFEPSELTMDSEIPFTLASPAVRIIAYGIACEYDIISGLTAEATVWENKFIDGLKSATSKKREMKVRNRRWI